MCLVSTRLTLLLSFLFSSTWVSGTFASESPWQDVDPPPQTFHDQERRTLTLDVSTFYERLNGIGNLSADNTHYAYKSSTAKTSLVLPLPDGSAVEVSVDEMPVMAPELAEKFPNIRTYKLTMSDANQGAQGYSISQGRLSTSGQGVYVVLQTDAGEKVFIEPVVNDSTDGEKRTYYTSSWGGNNESGKTSSCQLGHEHESIVNRSESLLQAKQSTASVNKVETELYIYRIAVSATEDYVNAYGGNKTAAMAAIVRTINRINQIYERDAGIRLQLVAKNDLLIAPASAPFSGSLEDMLSQNQILIDKLIGSDHYDIGHLFTTHGGGLAYVRSACRSNVKAMGVSGNLSVGSERFSLEFVAHEIGHQFGATHTFNSNQGLCTDRNRNASTAYEPGSGSTIMAYIGICGSDNLQNQADAMFHIGTIQQMMDHKLTHYVNGCGVKVTSGNRAPQVDAGADYVIPANTPFELRGIATDPDSNALLYNWQQQDAGLASQVNVDTGNNALFRSYLPNTSAQRSFPRKSALLGGDFVHGETLPNTNRVMNFSFIAQDSVGATASDSMMVNVIANGRSFRLHTPPTYYTRGQVISVTWDVAETDLPPVSCSSVNISLSTDNGLNFDQQLADNIPNTGSAQLTLPASVTENRNARLKLSCSDNIFFSISTRSFGVAEKGTESTNTSSAGTGSTNKTQGGAGSLSYYWLLMFFLCLILREKMVMTKAIFRSCKY